MKITFVDKIPSRTGNHVHKDTYKLLEIMRDNKGKFIKISFEDEIQAHRAWERIRHLKTRYIKSVHCGIRGSDFYLDLRKLELNDFSNLTIRKRS